MGKGDEASVAAQAKLPHRGAEKVDVRGGPPASTFSWGAWACRGIVSFVWSITPLSWLYFTWSILPLNLVQRILGLDLPVPPRSGLPLSLHRTLLIYTGTEVLFSIYYFRLVRKLQVKTMLPPYGRAFLRQTLARALEDGMKLEDPDTIMRHTSSERHRAASIGRRPRRLTFSRADFSHLSFLDKANPLVSDDPRAIEWREMFSSWFMGIRWEELKRDNILEWLAWSFYSMSLEDVQREWIEEGRPILPETIQGSDEVLNETSQDEGTGGKLGFCHHGLYMLEARAAMALQPGRALGKSIRLHLDPVRATSRPLIKYLVTAFFNVVLERRTASFGFRKCDDGALEYLIRMPSDWKAGCDEATRPVIFVHGLGMGLAQYASFISYFEQHPALKARPLILLIQPHLSMAFFHRKHLIPPNKEMTTKGLRDLVKKWGFEGGVTVLSHSNGTIVHGWLLKDCPDLVKRSCFVDPVTFCLWEPSVAYNFLYRKPQRGIEILMRYFVGEEIGIALMLQRYFDWSANILWYEEIPSPTDNHRTMFVLAEKDSVLDAKRTARYLRDHGARYTEEGGNIRFLPGCAHGEALITGGSLMLEFMDWLTQETPIEVTRHMKTKDNGNGNASLLTVPDDSSK